MLEKKNIQLLSWFKNNEEWYTPSKKEFLNLDNWEHYEIINYYHVDNFLVYCWNGDKSAQNGKLYKGICKKA